MASATRSFSTSARRHGGTIARQKMREWFDGPGKELRMSPGWRTNYLGGYSSGKYIREKQAAVIEDDDKIRQDEIDAGLDEEEMTKRAEERAEARRDARPRLAELRPFPRNLHFVSQSVLSEDMREEIYNQVVIRKLDVSSVSAAYGIDSRRIAAVARLKTIEKQWETEGKPLAKPYNKAILNMVPVTPFRNHEGKTVQHETINDLAVLPSTRRQIFYSASESRQFTREDAAKAFSRTLLPADKRIAHPELIEIEKMSIAGLTPEEKRERIVAMDVKSKAAKARAEEKKRLWEERTQKLVPGRRWDFKFQDISVDAAGKDGRGQNGVGYRYGVPNDDRKRGLHKIQASVE